jgi:hypothetical protein
MQSGLVNSGLYQVVGPFVPVHGGIYLLLPAPQNGVQAGRRADRPQVTDDATKSSYDAMVYMRQFMDLFCTLMV